LRIVIGLGGNALLNKQQQGFFEEHIETLSKIAPQLVRVALENEVIVTHGNGPQVGVIYLQQEHSADVAPPMPLHACVAMSQGLIGYMIQQAITQAALSMGVKVEVACLISRVLVERSDPAFQDPCKPIGPSYNRDEALALSKRKGWVVKEVKKGVWKRVVPSPQPREVLELNMVSDLLRKGRIVIAAGGGGVPISDERELRGVDAVVDKDLTSSLLAIGIGADILILLTNVKGVYLNYGTPSQVLLRRIKAKELEKYLARGYFPPGSMGPKVKAAVEFVSKTGKPSVIGHLKDLERIMRKETGTLILP